jgi:hypothetical protein
MKLLAATIVAGASTAHAGPTTRAVQVPRAPAPTDWASYVDLTIKPRMIGDRPAAGNTGGKVADTEDTEPARVEREQARSLDADLAAFEAALRSRSAATPKPAKPMRVPGLTDQQLAELEPMDLAKPGYIELRLKPTPEEVVIRPRRLANARPACGNTGGKDPQRPARDCSTADIALAAELDRWEIQQAQKRSEKLAHDSVKIYAAATAMLRATPSLKARLLVNGRPACGNTQGKASSRSYCEGE